MLKKGTWLLPLLLLAQPLLGSEVLDTFYSTYFEWWQGSYLVRLEIPEDGWIASFEQIGNIGIFVECLEFSQDGFFYGVDVLGDSLIRIDPVTGEGTPVGNMGVFATGMEGGPDLSEDEDGQLWMFVDEVLYRVDRATGAASFDCQATSPVIGLTFLNTEKITGVGPPWEPGCGLRKAGPDGLMETGTDGWVYGMFALNPHSEGTGMRRMNPATGEQETVQALWWGYGLIGISLGPDTPQQAETPIPTLDPRGVVVMCALLAVAAIAILCRGGGFGC